MANRWWNSGNSGWLYFSGLQNHCRWWLQPWYLKMLTLGRKVVTNLDSILKSRDITLPTKVCLVKVMVFPVVMYGCESLTKKKAECRRINAFELWCWGRLLRVPWTARRSNQSILNEISPGCSLEGLMLKLKLQYFGQLMQIADSLEKTLIAGKDWGQEEETSEDEMVGWHHQLNGHGLGGLWELVMDREAWRLQFMGLQSRTWLSDWTELNVLKQSSNNTQCFIFPFCRFVFLQCKMPIFDLQ